MTVKTVRRRPLLLSPAQNYVLFGIFFLGNVAVLIALILGAAKNKSALDSIALAAEVAKVQEREAERPAVHVYDAPSIPAPEFSRPSPSFLVSVPPGWRWKGCRMLDEGAVEVSLTPPR